MQSFNVLDRNLKLHQHHLLEASAGTGKTFSIQNIVTRLLIEEADDQTPLLIDQILVVTFTRAATRELKARIHANLETVLHYLEHWLFYNTIPEEAPDYLVAIMQSEENTSKIALKRVQRALFNFDQAQIFTIHAFCARMLKQYALEGDLGLHAIGGEKPLSNSEILSVMKDFLRTEIHPELYSADQIEKLLSGDREQTKLLNAIKSSSEIIALPSYKQLFDRFICLMKELKEKYNLESEKLLNDFELQSVFYKNHSKESKADTLERVIAFTALFDKQEWTDEDFNLLIRDGLVWTLALDINLLKKKLPVLSLNYRGFSDDLRQELECIVNQAGDFSTLLARLAKDFKFFLKRYQHEEEKLSPDDFLIKMNEALDQSIFLKNVQSHYQAAIIDEFQDTDSLQWGIFKKLFLPTSQEWIGHLYLVGDPKQSIYSFRQADIYTYLSAAQALGPAHCFTLDVNHRSHPQLVNGLNALFDVKNMPSFISLPKIGDQLTYKPVKARECEQPLENDGRGAVHFFVGQVKEKKMIKIEDYEKEQFFPFIIQEIKKLHQANEMNFGQFAILVRDRHQARRLSESLAHASIPYTNQRRASLTESPVLPALVDLLRVLLHPRDLSAVKAALGSPLLGWTDEEIRVNEGLENVLITLQRLHSILIEKGFSHFYQELLQSHWKNTPKTLLELILSRENGIDFLHDLQQLTDLIIENQYREWNSPEGIIPFLDQLKIWDEDEDDRLKRTEDFGQEGVKILTLHYSKGLEFDVVFALGLVNRKKMTEHLINTETTGLIPATWDPAALKHYCEEMDAEKMRQLYVTLTRAKYRLYIPLAQAWPAEKIQMGEASPLDLFLARFKEPVGNYTDLYERIKKSNPQSLLEFIEKEGSSHSITYEMCENVDLNVVQKAITSSHQLLIPPKSVLVNHPSLFVTSYSGISHQHPESHIKLPQEEKMPHDYQALSKTIHTLPASAETGVIIHSLLEKINFTDLAKVSEREEILPLICAMIQYTRYKEWALVLADLLYATLKTNLNINGELFCLADLKSDQQYREMPFLFSFDEIFQIEGLEYSKGLIKGVIDLIFLHEGRYYVIDWKTNWLGTSIDDYSSQALEQAMNDNHYFVQAKIYREALQRFIHLVDSRPFEECFGGMYYLFLRGMSPGLSNGIYSIDTTLRSFTLD